MRGSSPARRLGSDVRLNNPLLSRTALRNWRGSPAELHRHCAPLVSPADLCCLLAVTGDDPHALVELGENVLRRAGFEKRDAVLPASGEDTLARLFHLGRIRVARD